MRYTQTGQKQMTDGDPDYRYTIRVTFLREGRPNYWNFGCCNRSCGAHVCEVNGTILYLNDITPQEDTKATHIQNRIRCPGKFCKFWYEFANFDVRSGI